MGPSRSGYRWIGIGVLALLAAALGVRFVSNASSPTGEPTALHASREDVAPVVPAPASSAAQPMEFVSRAEAPAAVASPTERPAEEPAASTADLSAAACFESMLTDAPDVSGVAAWAERFARAAQVDPNSIEVDAATGVVKGELTAPGVEGSATFAIRGTRYEVSLWPPAEGDAKQELPLRSVRWAFQDDSGAVAKPLLSLQHHPDTNRAVSEFVDGGAERIVGWTLSASDRGATAAPIVVRASTEEPGAWIIGRSETTPKSDWPSYFIDGSHKTFLAKLSSYAAK